MTTSLSSSLDMLSLTSSTRWASDSLSLSDDDEIVWSLSSSAVLSSSSPLNSPLSETADYVLVPRIDSTRTASAAVSPPTADADAIAKAMAALSLSGTAASKPRRTTDDLSVVVRTTSSGSVPEKTKTKKARHAGRKAGTGTTTTPPASAATSPSKSQQGPMDPPAEPRNKGRKPRPRKPKTRSSPSPSPSPSSPLDDQSAAARAAPSSLPSPPPSSSQSPPPPLPSPPAPPSPKVTKRPDDGCSSSAVPARKSKKGSRKGTTPAVRRRPSIQIVVPPALAPTATAAANGADLNAQPMGIGLRAVVDDSLSEASGDDDKVSSSAPPPTTTTVGYDEAHKFMTSYLAHPPPPGNNSSALLMLQALILELGCLPSVAAAAGKKFSIPELPSTLRQAKLLLKSHVFINVRDYLAMREQGQAALRRAMHPNRKSLVQEVRKGKRLPVQEVKKAGLKVLLVNTRH